MSENNENQIINKTTSESGSTSDVSTGSSRGKGRPKKGSARLSPEEKLEAKRIANERYRTANIEKIRLYNLQKYYDTLEISRMNACIRNQKYYESNRAEIRMKQSISYYSKVYANELIPLAIVC